MGSEDYLSARTLLPVAILIYNQFGMHAYTLWGDPYVLKDGSHPEPSLKQQMVRYSWSIPIQTFVRL
ncbi:MAG: hypothetical protein KME26_08730 [Oscillatoria princeps RMCB-10]|nr:hypothetical protein [Oscillatoria princeps RMCB-10]